ncbi:YlmC/YmxH family sporulation protein [Paenibacillus polymyxa]|jgi:YlmC/YmxH family sporulation protein|uniref:YlmC/YmxH family sporulation protein n=1 Tax=Paenibacillus TaxID=44249 RepID=UPI00030E024B|nr:MULTISPECIES: YlmC/YmxH family sporulation protein [Paenibacillus]AHM66979.1 sporulation protein, ylmc/ymxh family [Paenibacillus polymyxa SQR-21]AUS27560.1 sporulation protein, ylmc/ymxh family [Paenibacillus polymyxa]KAF6585748.1 YlmC/YmxH family sporulation protein [Paenibacillus sp. EKM211P]KAF6659154.1 YlmC/YmxH family sporulation protein [Paenibacillus sp. EKM301P]MBY0022529.1 YlmC/YmxH family sporulation protein [Paenibacillus polymyxa]
MRVNAPETSVRAMKISEFQTKDVINIVDGRRLGQISDLEIDVRQGKIEAIVVPGSSRFMGWFGGGSELVIPWRNIVKIGSDVVLVRLEGLHEPPDEREEKSYIERQERNDRRGF